jgi:hypothetical protein
MVRLLDEWLMDKNNKALRWKDKNEKVVSGRGVLITGLWLAKGTEISLKYDNVVRNPDSPDRLNITVKITKK